MVKWIDELIGTFLLSLWTANNDWCYIQGTIAFLFIYFLTNCFFGLALIIRRKCMHKSLFINCVSWNHMQAISPRPGVQVKVSRLQSQVASPLVHGPERQPLCFINSLGARHCPLISCLGRQPDSKWKRITAHLHVSWSAMTTVKAKGIFSSKCISRYSTFFLPILSFQGRTRVTGIYKYFSTSAFCCENTHSCQMLAG